MGQPFWLRERDDANKPINTVYQSVSTQLTQRQSYRTSSNLPRHADRRLSFLLDGSSAGRGPSNNALIDARQTKKRRRCARPWIMQLVHRLGDSCFASSPRVSRGNIQQVATLRFSKAERETPTKFAVVPAARARMGASSTSSNIT